MSVFRKFFYSRKFWTFLVGFVTLLGTTLEDGVVTSQETQAISALVIGYIFSIAFEDGMSQRGGGTLSIPTTELRVGDTLEAKIEKTNE